MNYSAIYTDAYLFDLATRELESGKSSVDVAEHLVRVCELSRDAATSITSIAFDPSSAR